MQIQPNFIQFNTIHQVTAEISVVPQPPHSGLKMVIEAAGPKFSSSLMIHAKEINLAKYKCSNNSDDFNFISI